MKMTLPIATARLSREINTAHVAIDEALVATAALFHSASAARSDLTEFDPVLGQAAMLRMHKGLGNLLAVRTDLIRAHVALKKDAGIVMGPDEPTCPENPLTTATIDGERASAT